MATTGHFKQMSVIQHQLEANDRYTCGKSLAQPFLKPI
jgi:hypothetical protein